MKQHKFLIGIASFLLLSSNVALDAQDKNAERVEMLPYGNMDTWMVRSIKESGLIGGNTRYFHEIAKGDTLKDVPYKNTDSPWATSSVLAKVSKITKASYTVFPEKRGSGYAARLETRIEAVKVFGLININVLASGTIFLGEMVEPITSTDNPMQNLNVGISFTKRPKALQYDYKVTTGGKSIRSTGFSGQKKLDIKDKAEVYLYLQHRWEDANGNLYAKRVATAWENYSESKTDWQNKHRVEIHYGNITSKPFYTNDMRLRTGDETYYARNSKGVMVPVKEVGWATENDAVTHIMLQFSSSNGGAYIGSIDSRLWIDNVGLVY